MNVGRRNARSRLAHLYCEVACRTGRRRVADGYRFDFPITQFQLADMLGLTPVHVNRTIKSLREDGLVAIAHRVVQILDWSRLVEIGEFDPTYLRLSGSDGGCQPAINNAEPRPRMVQ